MKKTLIALIALAGVVMAEEVVTMNLFASNEGWTFAAGQNVTLNTSDETLTANKHWGQPWANFTLTDAITLRKDQTLTLSYTLGLSRTSDVAATVALHSSANIVAAGLATYNGSSNDAPFGIGFSSSSDAINANSVYLGPNGYSYKITDPQYSSYVADIDYDYMGYTDFDLTEEISWDGAGSSFVAKVYVDDNYIGSYNVGQTYTLDKVSVTLSGNTTNFNSVPVYKQMTLTLTPEPATATLSLLALAALASRRKRH